MTGSEQQARVAAGEFRRMHRLGLQPLGDLVALIEQTTGYEVAVLDADYGEHGLTMRDPVRDATFIGVARSRTPMRQRSTLAHELGHLVFGDCDHGVEFAKRSPEEIRADAFARHLLVPVEGVTEFLGQRDGAGMTDLAAVVQRFLVSPAIAAIAMRDAGYVSGSTVKEWKPITTGHLATLYGWSDYYESLCDNSNRLRSPQSLVARAVNGYAAGVVSAQVIATLREVDVDVVLNELREAGIVPAIRQPVDMSADDLPDVEIDLSDLEDGDSLP